MKEIGLEANELAMIEEISALSNGLVPLEEQAMKDVQNGNQEAAFEALYGERLKWARPLDMFNSEVDHEKYPEVKQKYRFEEIE